MIKNIDISFVILTWNSEKYIDECLQSVISKCNEDDLIYEIFIVDNGSTDRTKNILKKHKEENAESIHTILLNENRGTTYPRNLALHKTKGKIICVMDSDATILSGKLRSALDYLDAHREIGILAPMLVLPDGNIQHSVKKFPTIIHKIGKLKIIFGGRSNLNLDFYDNFPFTEVTNVDTAIAACWFFNRSLINKIGYLDERIYYSPEDIDYCLRSWKAGEKVVYYPELKILHNTQQISHQSPFSKISISHILGLFYYFRKHSNWFTTKI